jgi:glycosyltransferase involved in cell wall biosynthesis
MRALYLSHTGMSEPLGRSQVLPYVRGLAEAGHEMELVSFEPAGSSDEDIARVRDELAALGVRYTWTRRSSSHSLPVKLAEAGRAFLSLVARALERRPRILHARSYLPGAVAQLAAAMVPGARFLFDCRGLLPDEYADSGHWPRDGFKHRLGKLWERALFRAHAVVTLTERLRRWLENERLVGARTLVEVIPCCVDVARFHPDENAREKWRRRLGIADDRLVCAYSGSLGTWYCEKELAELFAAVRRRRPAHLAVFTRSPTDELRRELSSRGVAEGEITISAVAPDDMPAALTAADVGLSLIRPVFSKIASSPVKLAEYLAVGLPVVVNRGIGDEDQMVRDSVVIDAGAMSRTDLEAAAARIVALPPPAESRSRARRLAEDHFDLEAVGIARYRRLYERLA